MTDLAAPTPELAAQVLRELDYAGRLSGVEMSPATGNNHRSIYSLQEAVDFLKVGELGELLLKGGQTSIGYVDLPELVAWLDEAVGDRELAAAVREALDRGGAYGERLLAAKELMAQRLRQCRAAVERA